MIAMRGIVVRLPGRLIITGAPLCSLPYERATDALTKSVSQDNEGPTFLLKRPRICRRDYLSEECGFVNGEPPAVVLRARHGRDMKLHLFCNTLRPKQRQDTSEKRR